MEKKQESLKTTHKSRKELIDYEEDFCQICDYSLYHNERYTKRIGMIDDNNKVIGWMCPECNSEVDLDNNISYIYGKNSIKGDA